jgi:iron complex outermembrane receptor protein
MPSAPPFGAAAPAPASAAPAPAASASGGSVPEDAPTDLVTSAPQPTIPKQLQRGAGPSGDLKVQELKTNTGLTIEEIVNSPIVSASSRKESALSAPATVIVLTARDIFARGYTELSQILDDLPGMDIVRPYGDIYVKSYWRGHRSSAGEDPYLVMVDGIVFNSLFFGDTQIFASFPLSNIDHIEIVYGPASALYGPNAEMGIINIITKDKAALEDANAYGLTSDVRITYGGAQRNLDTYSDSTKLVDATVSYGQKDWRVRVTTRIEDGALDHSVNKYFEYTNSMYLTDANWGPLLAAYPNLTGKFRSIDQKYAVDGRLYLGQDTEFGAQFFRLKTGLGVEYATDVEQNMTPWTRDELVIFGRQRLTLSPHFVSTTLLEYHQSNIASPSSYIFLNGGVPTFQAIVVPSSEEVIQQDFDADVAHSIVLEGDSLQAHFGVKAQHQDLPSNGYTYLSNTTFAGSTPTEGAMLSMIADSGAYTKDTVRGGAFALAKYSFLKDQALHVGVRGDYNGFTDSFTPTFRGGYVGTFGDLTGKLLYGQAVYTPGPFDVYQASGQLQDEFSQTLEASVQYTLAHLAILSGDVYDVQVSHPLTDTGAIGLTNGDSEEITGGDLGARAFFKPVELWAYYSHFFTAQRGSGPIGDLAFDKVWAGITYDRDPFVATLLGRLVGDRNPVSSNPTGTIPWYFTLDANVMVTHVGFEGLSLGFRAMNLLDQRYSEPGVGAANSGDTPGMVVNGTWTGSQGFFNSRLPQPGRSLFLTARLAL